MINKYPKRPNSLRLKGFDYSSQATYFLTMNVKNQTPIFANAVLRQRALVIAQEIAIVLNTELFCCCVMPDHVHHIVYNSGKSGFGINEYVRRFKSFVYRYYREQTGDSDSFWQRYYHDHIIRD